MDYIITRLDNVDGQLFQLWHAGRVLGTYETRSEAMEHLDACQQDDADHAAAETAKQLVVRILGFETAEVRNSDSLDFREINVLTTRNALEAAFAAGIAYARSQTEPKPASAFRNHKPDCDCILCERTRAGDRT